ncbi:FtsX-like permease family protein [Spirosoma taeanense]|uniref:FtsX-like permease family protein n=1 Tax=Spirosoma taeanense TaxID=2735870 RepID=A0A6M5YBS1_9BACT|nr:ABC transporter permease [Spirosoma taeanense]QJW91465.1 FtsX-like permease family protein [Spirosoma taeanense]
MLRNYLKIAFRNLLRHKSFTFINIVGLAIGLACCLAIVLFIQDELQYDRFNAKANRIYRVVTSMKMAEGREVDMARTPPAIGPALKATFPEVEEAVRIFSLGNGGEVLVSFADKKFMEPDVLLVDSSFFNVFSFPLVRGNPTKALAEPNSVVISESIAKKYFGSADPLNKTLDVAGGLKMRITGVMQDVPEHSHLKATCIGAFSTIRSIVESKRLENWGWQQFYTYIVLPENYDVTAFEPKLTAFTIEKMRDEAKRGGTQYQSRLQPLRDIYLRSSNLEYDIVKKGNINHVYAFAVIALFALLIACFNFMNLSTALSMQRAKEVGLRKVIGAGQSQLVRQFLGESVLLTLLALLVGIVIAQFWLYLFNDWMGKHLSFLDALNPAFIGGVLVATLLVGLLAGLYPAFFLSAFRPIKVLKGDVLNNNSGGYSLRKTLVVLQFAVSTALIIGTGIVFSQLNYIQRKDLGFNREQVIVLPIRTDAMAKGYESIKEELLRNPNIKAATACYGIPGGLFAGDGIRIPGREKDISTNMFLVDHDYVSTMGMQVVAGRNFSRKFGTDAEEGFIINETAAKTFGWGTPANAIGKEIIWEKWTPAPTPADSIKRGKVVGVVRDFNYKSLYQKVEPVVLHIAPTEFSSIVVRVQPENMEASLDFLKTQWQRLAPEWPFDYQMVDEQFADLYRSEQIFGKLFGLFTSLSILIACLGLFGLATFMVQQRFKEIGVRKVLGASVGSIVALLSKDFLRLVVIAIVLASPIAWYVMNRWLQDFAYKIDLAWWMFALAGLLAIGIALLTVSFQSIKAALMNPVKSLRTE